MHRWFEIALSISHNGSFFYKTISNADIINKNMLALISKINKLNDLLNKNTSKMPNTTVWMNSCSERERP